MINRKMRVGVILEDCFTVAVFVAEQQVGARCICFADQFRVIGFECGEDWPQLIKHVRLDAGGLYVRNRFRWLAHYCGRC